MQQRLSLYKKDWAKLSVGILPVHAVVFSQFRHLKNSTLAILSSLR